MPVLFVFFFYSILVPQFLFIFTEMVQELLGMHEERLSAAGINVRKKGGGGDRREIDLELRKKQED